jgi:hypothetical protein
MTSFTGCVISVAGNGGSIGGTIYVPRGTMAISGGGCCGSGWSISGRLVLQDLAIAGNPNAQLNLSGGGFTSTVSCYYYNESLTGANPSKSLPAQLLFETGCGSGGVNSSGLSSVTTVISFSYFPF